MKPRRKKVRYLLCLRNDRYAASLMDRRLYKQLPDADAEAHGLVRVVDESGEDYLYPKKLFTSLELPKAVVRTIAA